MGNLVSSTSVEDSDYYRSLGDKHAKQRIECLEISKQYFNEGDKVNGKLYAYKARENEVLSKQSHEQAAELIFISRNKGLPKDTVDLHGLRVKEALAKAREIILEAKKENRKSMTFIVGRGLHSADGVAKLKPAIMDLVNELHLRCTVGRNEGRILVELVEPGKHGWFMAIVHSCAIC
mmetsp:Transcript_35774/g.79611  ORF Transcript_35774/g.79611 Transcript_35774/m.79611 type:complete len:178 (+) Transcript_35774:145-678(+)